MSQIEKIRHSLSHIMAHAVKDLYKEAVLGMGPATSEGFYYDFGNVKISDTDFPQIEKRMRELIKQQIPFQEEIKSKEEAKEMFKDEPYKIEIIEEMEKDKVSVYRSGDFVDICSGPHIKNTKEINPNAFKLDRAAGAYFKGSEENPMLQRIYGLAFENKEKLEEYLKMREEAEERDHRKIGREMELFLFDEEVGQGLPLYLPKGAMLRHVLMDYVLNTYLYNNHQIVSTPHIAREDLWQHSGHLKFYSGDMYGPLSVEERNYRLKPMNCPFHVKMYKSRVRSYKELPIRWSEMGTVYRYEKSGEMHGLTRPRGFTQDDTHIICAKKQLEQEIITSLKITKHIYHTLGMEDLIFKLSIRDPKKSENYFGNNKDWEMAEKALKSSLSSFGLSEYELDEGGAAFYAPKIDIDAVDAMGRSWQLSTIQVDFNLTSRFNMNYVNEKGEQETPFMIHRALLGSIERFLGVYIEHTKGDFPFWLSPEQVWVVPISEKNVSYAKEIYQKLREERIRVSLKGTSENLSKTIRNGELQKIPYLLVVGEKEEKEKKVNIRSRKEKQETKSLEETVEKLKKEAHAKIVAIN